MKKLLSVFVLMLMVMSLNIPMTSFAEESSLEVKEDVVDFCLNYDGVQTTLPAGFKRAEGTSICVPINPPENLDNQCPVGSWPVDGGTCKLDVCFNLRGAQAGVPSGYEMKTPGQCTMKLKPAPAPAPALIFDMCLNFPGKQSKIPTGFTRYKENCYKIADMCWNIPETQLTVPTGYKAIDRTCLLEDPR